MRYAIGCTYTDPKTKITSSPYLVTYDPHSKKFDLTLNQYVKLNGKQIVYIENLNIANTMIALVKFSMLKYSNYKYYLLKIDSLNFPYKISKNKKYGKLSMMNNDIHINYETILSLK